MEEVGEGMMGVSGRGYVGMREGGAGSEERDWETCENEGVRRGRKMTMREIN